MATQNSRGGGVHLKVRGGGGRRLGFGVNHGCFREGRGRGLGENNTVVKKVGELSRRNLELKIIKLFSNRISIPIIRNNSNN